jgi:hypothetical protein
MRTTLYAATILTCLAAGAALAGPYTAGTGRCPAALGNEVYRCAVFGEDASQFTDCFRFRQPGAVSGKFEFVSDRLASAIGCTCKPAGPSFNASASFTCTGIQGVSFEGRILKDGSISKGTIANVNGGAFVFACQRDAACVATP